MEGFVDRKAPVWVILDDGDGNDARENAIWEAFFETMMDGDKVQTMWMYGVEDVHWTTKAGTVTPNIAQAITEIKAGKIEYRLDKTNIIHCPIGKVSFGVEKLVDNYTALITAIIKAKPAAAKGQYIKSCVTASTMGPGVKINAQKQL